MEVRDLTNQTEELAKLICCENGCIAPEECDINRMALAHLTPMEVATRLLKASCRKLKATSFNIS